MSHCEQVGCVAVHDEEPGIEWGVTENYAQRTINDITTWINNVVDDPSGNIMQDIDAAVNQAREEGIEEGKKVVERWLEFMMLSNDDLTYAAVYGWYQYHYKNGAVK